jgi:putative transposase
MNNHVHLLIETQKVPLSKILQGVNQSYTAYFNRRYKTVGHLFQGRYKAILYDRDEYLFALVKYIHLNPVRARIVQTPDEYQWSSHHSYAKKTGKKGITDEDQVLRMFSEDKTTARRLYREYIGDGRSVKKDDIYSTIDQRILGDERFAEKVMEIYDESIEPGRRNKEYKLSEIASEVEEAYGITLKEIRGKGKDRGISLGRKLLSLTAKEYGYKGNEIAEFTKKDPAIITRHLRERDKLKKEIERVIGMLKDKRKNVNSQV